MINRLDSEIRIDESNLAGLRWLASQLRQFQADARVLAESADVAGPPTLPGESPGLMCHATHVFKNSSTVAFGQRVQRRPRRTARGILPAASHLRMHRSLTSNSRTMSRIPYHGPCPLGLSARLIG